MLDIGWQELFLIGVVALIVVGPKDLPKALRTGARMLNKARAMSRDFQSGLAEMAREAELDELKRNVEGATRFDAAAELKRAVDPTGKFTEDFDPAEFNRRIKAAVEGGPPTGPATPLPPTPEEPAAAVPAAEPAPLPPPTHAGSDTLSPAADPAPLPPAPEAAMPPPAAEAAMPPPAPGAASGR